MAPDAKDLLVLRVAREERVKLDVGLRGHGNMMTVRRRPMQPWHRVMPPRSRSHTLSGYAQSLG